MRIKFNSGYVSGNIKAADIDELQITATHVWISGRKGTWNLYPIVDKQGDTLIVGPFERTITKA